MSSCKRTQPSSTICLGPLGRGLSGLDHFCPEKVDRRPYRQPSNCFLRLGSRLVSHLTPHDRRSIRQRPFSPASVEPSSRHEFTRLLDI